MEKEDIVYDIVVRIEKKLDKHIEDKAIHNTNENSDNDNNDGDGIKISLKAMGLIGGGLTLLISAIVTIITSLFGKG